MVFYSPRTGKRYKIRENSPLEFAIVFVVGAVLGVLAAFGLDAIYPLS